MYEVFLRTLGKKTERRDHYRLIVDAASAELARKRAVMQMGADEEVVESEVVDVGSIVFVTDL